VMGLPKGSDWAFLANYLDKTQIRAALVHDLGQSLGRYNPRFRFTELFVNNQYQGLYTFIERIRRDAARVGIPKPAPDAASGDITGGYIFRHEGKGRGGGRDWTSPNGVVWSYHYPRIDEITAAQKTYLQDHVRQFEAAMNAPDWANPTTGYPTWIDVPSWVDYVLTTELTNNWDGYVRSVWFHKQSKANGGLIYASPLWDYDLAFGVVNLGTSFRTDAWLYKQVRAAPENVPFFFLKLWTEPAFQKAVKCRWQELRKGPLDRTALFAKMDRWHTELAPALKRDQEKWKTIGVKVSSVVYYTGKTFEEDVAWMKDWIDKRLKWLDGNLPGTCP
jgi:hypothetical protein